MNMTHIKQLHPQTGNIPPVILMGAGPGDPELLTVKAWKALQGASLILYDHLVSEAILNLAPPSAERMYVGKESSRHALPQSEICELMVRLARAGRSVLRLKGGDGYIFGRGGEEAQALAEAVRRVASIAIVHETLSTSSAETVLFDEVYDRIIRNAIELSARPIQLHKTGEFGVFGAQQATPLALVITELIHNSLEHGLETEGDQLRVEVVNDGKTVTVTVIDNGVGLPEGFTYEGSSNLGLQIVRTLTENELKGQIKLTRVSGETQAKLTFPAVNLK